MPSYISDRYAGILTKEDIGQLFNNLTERLLGNRSEAARQCGLTGKATYDWEEAAYVKLGTKRKVLEACLRTDFLNTIKYLLSRSSERTVDILRTILSTIYAEAIETESKERFISLIDVFENLRIEYRGLIRDRIMDEMADMLLMLRQKALELEVSVPPKSIEDISAKEFLEVFPLIGNMYLSNPQGAHVIANTLDFPLELIEMLWPTFKKLQRATEKVTEVEPAEIGKIIATGGVYTIVDLGKGILITNQVQPWMHIDTHAGAVEEIWDKMKAGPGFGTSSEIREKVWSSANPECVEFSTLKGDSS